MAAAAAGKHLDLPWESRAPPPSPIAGAPEPPETGGGELAGFLSRSQRVPNLVLPDRIFHRTAWKLPEIDLPSLISPDPDESALDLVRSAAASFGCFQISNHGIPDDLIAAAGSAAAAPFQMSAEKKKKASRSPERDWGFETEDEKEERNGFSEEFFWWRRRGEEEMAGIWPQGFKDFSDKMERLWAEAEKITFKIEQILLGGEGIRGASDRSALYLHKHRRSSANGDRPGGSLNHDVLRMLIRGSGSSHALGLHSCGGASRFHAYSKRGCVPFPLNKAALVLTVGDQIQ